MDAQEFRSLQEAYEAVYENQQLDEVLDTPEKANEYARKNVRSMLGAFAKGVANKDISQLKTINKRTEGAKRAKRKAERKAAEEMKEGYDFFDVILEHLVAEGYADTNEAALAIMANMSEEWKQSIVEQDLTARQKYLVGKVGEMNKREPGSAHKYTPGKQNPGAALDRANTSAMQMRGV